MYNVSTVDFSDVSRIVSRFEADKKIRRQLSTTEQIVLAFVYSEPAWLPEPYTHPLRALFLLGENWTKQAIAYHVETTP